MLEPIDFTSTNTYSFESLGKVESKIISAKDEYILRIDLYESYGSCVLGEFYIGPATIGSIDDFIITTNGYITTIEVGGGDSGNIVYPGLIAAWSAKGKTNDDEDRAILKDLTGNGHDITLNGFAFSEMSGYGGYSINFKNEYTSRIFENRAEGVVTQNKIIVTSIKNTQNFFEDNNTSNIHPSYKIKATGVSEELYIKYMYSSDKSYDIKTEGIHVIPESEAIRYVGFRANKIVESCDITIELLPEYPDALVFDGVVDYGINENMPILTDYTIIAKRGENHKQSCLFTKGYGVTASAFIFEGESFNYSTYNFGRENNINILTNSDISWQTKNYYNGQSILFGRRLDVKGGILGKISLEDNRFFKGTFYSAYLFDRSLDEQEIKEFIRKYIDPEYLLPSEQTTE
nr:MAG TPA: hypothetical protein [Caudoviricetes sp.]